MNWFKRKPVVPPVPAERWVVKHETEHYVYLESTGVPPTLETLEELRDMGYRVIEAGMKPWRNGELDFTCEKIS